MDGVVIGECGTSGPANEAGDVEIGYGLAAPYRGLGFGTEMLVGLSRWLLAQDGVHRVTAGGVRADDIPSRRALERAGFEWDRPTETGAWYSTRCPRTVPRWFDR
jgi:RimJ/RimL family protein N-acetyltransferase